MAKVFFNLATPFAKIFENYYWCHRNLRVSKIYKFFSINRRDFEDLVFFGKSPTKENVKECLVGLKLIKAIFNTKINKCIKNLEESYLKDE